ncbi:MAG: cyclic nucleotide-binding domain-containing protein [Anaerolineae bacterium]|nr:cyclic nucleotide-binding domain-containing protein [Anaerolineae bacterium]
MQEVAQQLQETAIFKGVDLEALEALIGAMAPRTFEDGAVLFHKGAAGDEMYVILSGRVRIFLPDSQGDALTFRYYGQGQVIGDFALLNQQARSASAAAVGEVRALALSREAFLAFLSERPAVGLAMMRNLTERIRYTQTYLEHVMAAVESLAEGAYGDVFRQFSAADAGEEIDELIAAFLHMVRSVAAREADLKQELARALASEGGDGARADA